MSTGPQGEERYSPLTILEDRVLDTLIPLLGFVGAPAVTYAIWLTVESAHHPWFLFAEALAVYVTGAVGVLLRNRRRWVALAMTAGAMTASACSLLHFGPILGVGFLAAIAVILSSFFYRKLGAAAFVAVLIACFVAMGLSDSVPAIHSSKIETLAVLIRVGLTFVVSTVGVAAFTLALVGSLEDVLEQMEAARRSELEAQAERERAVNKAASAQQIGALGRLVGGVAHDFNNTLAILRLNVELLMERRLNERETTELLEDMSEAIDAAKATTQQLREFVADDADAAKHSKPDEVIPRFVARIRRLLEEDIRVEHVVSECTDSIPLAPGALDQMLLNFCLNSRDAGSSTVEIGCRSDGSRVHLWVEDDGSGIPEDVAKHVFEPFFSTKGSRGTGLGLAMIYHTIEDTGGTLELTTAAGEGTRFDIELPVVTPEEHEGVEAADDIAGSESHHILVVEDRVPLLRAMQRQLEHAGYAVKTATSLDEARSVAHEVTLDLVCTDGILEDGRASDVIRIVEQVQGREIPIIVCSAYSEERVFRKSRGRSQYSFLSKPFRTKALVERVQAMIGETTSEERVGASVDVVSPLM